MTKRELIGPADIIVRAWETFRTQFRTYAELVVWFALLSVVQWALVILTKTTIEDGLSGLFIQLLISIPLSLLFALLTVAMIDISGKTLQKKKISVRQSLSVGAHRLLPFVWVSILTGLMVVLGLIMLVIPALIFFVLYKFAVAYNVIDDVRGSAALGASHKLVAGRWWAVFYRIFLPLLFFSLVASFAQAILYLIIGSTLGDPRLFFGPAGGIEDLPAMHSLITSVVPQVVTGFTLPLLIVADLVLWFDLKEKR